MAKLRSTLQKAGRGPSVGSWGITCLWRPEEGKKPLGKPKKEHSGKKKNSGKENFKRILKNLKGT